MRIIIKYVWVGIMFLSGLKSYAQNMQSQMIETENQNLFFSELRNSGATGLSYADIKGSPYYSDDFNVSDIYFKNGNIIKETSIRLNLYKKALEFQRDGVILEMIHMEDLDHINIKTLETIQMENLVSTSFKEEQFVFINSLDIPEDEGFYKIEVNGKYQLLRLLQVAYFDGTKAKSFYEDDTPAEFKLIKENYYLRVGNNEPIAFGNKRNFEKTFSNDFPELIDYAKDKKLNPSKYNDLVKMIQYLNSL